MYVVNAIFADQVPLDVMEKIAARNDVFQIQANSKVDTDLEETEYIVDGPSNDIEWNIKIINATYLWDKGFYGQGMVVGNSDTGVKWDHPALKHNYRGVKSDGTVDHNYSWWDPAGKICKAPCKLSIDYFPNLEKVMITVMELTQWEHLLVELIEKLVLLHKLNGSHVDQSEQ